MRLLRTCVFGAVILSLVAPVATATGFDVLDEPLFATSLPGLRLMPVQGLDLVWWDVMKDCDADYSALSTCRKMGW